MGILSIVPIVITLAVAIWSRNVILGLLVGVFSGVLILNGPNPFTGMSIMVEDYIVAQASKSANAGILVMMICISGLVGLMEKSGGAAAFAASFVRYVTSGAKAQLAAWTSGALLFFTDSGTPLIVGPLFRPITDGLKISRVKLAWIIDSTASPVCVLIPFIGWGLYSQGLMAEEFTSLAIKESAFAAYVKAVPFQFYSVLAVIMVPAVILGNADFGPMKIFEQNRANGIIPDYEKIEIPADIEDKGQSNAKPILVWLPLLTMLTVMFGLLVPKGFPFDMTNIPSNAFRGALSSGYIIAAGVLIVLMARHKVRGLAGGFSLYIQSIGNIVSVLVILVLAWSLGALGKELGAPAFIAALVDGRLPVFLLPAAVFVVGGIISFATGRHGALTRSYCPL